MRVYVTIVEGYFMELSIGEGSNKKVTIDDGNFFWVLKVNEKIFPEGGWGGS